MAILDKTDNHWSLPKDFDLNVLARCCGTKPKIILGSYQLLIEMKWISVGVDEDQKQFIFAPNYAKYRGNRVHEKETVKQVSSSPPYLPFPLKEIHKEKVTELDTSEEHFEKFWKAYPARKGKKLDKPEAQKRFLALGEEDRILSVQAAKNYSESEMVTKGMGIKDAKRFLGTGKGNEPWRDWIEPEQKATVSGSPIEGACTHRIDVDGRLKPCGQPARHTVGKTEMCEACYQAYQYEHVATEQHGVPHDD
jgi:hypothetical protein